MIKDLKITLYDIFGYFLPGIVCFSSIAVLFWCIYYPQIPISFPINNIELWLIIILLSYFCGHMVQAVGNMIMKVFPSVEEEIISKGVSKYISPNIIILIKAKMNRLLNIEINSLEPEILFKICDETILQYGIIGDREIYQYREGFYRGLSVAFLLLSLSFLIRIFIKESIINYDNNIIIIKWQIILFLITISLLFSILSFLRYRRFGKYRVIHAILSYLILENVNKKDISGGGDA